MEYQKANRIRQDRVMKYLNDVALEELKKWESKLYRTKWGRFKRFFKVVK